MTSLATMFAYADLQPVIDGLGECYDKDGLHKRLTCLIAFHSCRPDTFAAVYAWGDILETLGLGWTMWPSHYVMTQDGCPPRLIAVAKDEPFPDDVLAALEAGARLEPLYARTAPAKDDAAAVGAPAADGLVPPLPTTGKDEQ